ncbi:polysaccharide lyase family 8 super-sandwich domain-containing protein [Cyclobacterium salsum]|uniref:polysaccharide lyase family 8 super-sandwich domain-containing protein n=1 Tax=Cyclobacterium salsum TaxID=2666329 RepID=UPI001390D5A1|nr:polysaccharide lyase family 8 super-sandwich domain-containing protein [Cyclobacterium salsum]
MNPAYNLFIALLTITLVEFSTCAKADDFERIKGRVVDQLMGSGVNDGEVAEIIGIVNEDGSYQGIDYEDLSREAGFPHGRHTRNLVSLARAYQHESSRYYQDENIKNIIIRGLEFWVERDFVGENWHNNQITTPTNLVNLMLIIGDELPAELVGQAQPMIRRATMVEVPGVFYGARPGGDRIAIAAISAKNFLFLNDKEAFHEVIQIIAGEIKFTTGERGMQHDFSFHHRHDRVNNTTSYGYGKYANTFGEWSSYVANTKYQFPTDRINLLVDYYLDGIYKHMVYGVYTDVATHDRSIANHRRSTPGGTLEIERLLQSTDYRSDELKDILKLRKGEEANIRSFAKFFWHSEHFTFQRPHFYTSIRMHSTRNRTYEVPYNGPGITTHHRADGANYLSIDAHEYDGIWPVYDWQKVSGATIMQKPEHHVARSYGGNMPVQMEGLTDYVGAVDDGRYGAVAYDFKSPHDLLEAKKSWFFFDKEYVCLGAGIKSNPNLPAYTTINQAHLRGDVTVSQKERVELVPQSNSELENVKWVHHDRVGYLLPEPATVNLSNKAEQGRWSDISAAKSASDELVTQEVFLLGIDHGNSPSNASYQYIVVPGVTSEELASSSVNNRNIEILSNTPDLQAVIHNGLGISQLAFYKAGEVEIADGYMVRMDSQGMVMLKMNGNRIEELSVSDPSRKLTRVTLTVPGTYNLQGENFITLPNNDKNSTLIIVDLPTDVYAGSSTTVEFQKVN